MTTRPLILTGAALIAALSPLARPLDDFAPGPEETAMTRIHVRIGDKTLDDTPAGRDFAVRIDRAK